MTDGGGSQVYLNTLLQDHHVHQPVQRAAHLRPVLLALLLPLLHDVGDHHHHLHPLLPDHPPEVRDGVRQGTLERGIVYLGKGSKKKC